MAAGSRRKRQDDVAPVWRVAQAKDIMFGKVVD